VYHKRVLIIHPDGLDCTFLASMLQAMGHGVESAADSADVLGRVTNGAVDLVVLRAQIDDGRAMDLLLRLRKTAPAVNAIVVSPAIEGDRVRAAMERGATAVLKLPLAATTLQAAVIQALNLPATPARDACRGSMAVPGFSASRFASPQPISRPLVASPQLRQPRDDGPQSVPSPVRSRRSTARVQASSEIGVSRTLEPLKKALEKPERRIILQTLEALDWNRVATARVLDIDRSTLYKKMVKYRLFPS
jgi:DNA-binding NtrC family response regulator